MFNPLSAAPSSSRSFARSASRAIRRNSAPAHFGAFRRAAPPENSAQFGSHALRRISTRRASRAIRGNSAQFGSRALRRNSARRSSRA
eukprot:7006456-Alexandrium_andersonii.AAC.1